jgi:chromosome segregation protein
LEAEAEETAACKAREELAASRIQLEGEATAAASERESLGAHNDKLEDFVKEERIRAAERQETVHRLELAVTKVEMEIEVSAGRLLEEYGLNKEEALKVEPLSGDREVAAAVVDDLKRKISVLGNVNLDAIEEYEKVKERYSFLSHQRKDLVEARDSLLKAIEEIQRTTERRFQETFDAVHAEFSALFADIFGGGQAELTLTDPDDLSETGIEIYAQPPGKKPQSLLLLSTGERTLTAIALLLAIFRVKPSPFCLLDEVDAALDEANLGRFVGLLQKFAEKTQFIVITHRRRTMEAATVLYGVTMEELGVSKLISVRLEDAG